MTLLCNAGFEIDSRDIAICPMNEYALRHSLGSSLGTTAAAVQWPWQGLYEELIGTLLSRTPHKVFSRPLDVRIPRKTGEAKLFISQTIFGVERIVDRVSEALYTRRCLQGPARRRGRGRTSRNIDAAKTDGVEPFK